MLRQGLETDLGIDLRSSHPVMSWMVEHAAGVLSKYVVGADGRNAYDRVNGKVCECVRRETHYKYPKGTRRHGENLEDDRVQGHAF